MKNLKATIVIILAMAITSCAKNSVDSEVLTEGHFLKFKAKTKGEKVLYSDWIDSQFPTSSLNHTEFFTLPLIQNKYFDTEKDVIMVFGKRNTIFPMPVTIAQSLESYFIELLSGPIGTSTRIGVTSLDLNALQNLFFRGTAGSQFRVIIIPGEKLLKLSSKGAINFEKMSYQELLTHFALPE